MITNYCSANPESHGTNTNGAVVWHVGRCGSSVLGNCLAQHPLIQHENEIFNRWMPQNRGKKNMPPLEEQLEEVKKNLKCPYQVIEVKFLYSQHLGLFNMRFTELLTLLRNYGFTHHIILKRENILRRMVSHCVAVETQLFHRARSEKLVLQRIHMNIQAIKVGMDTAPLLEWMTQIETAYTSLEERLGQAKNTLHLTYEQHIEPDPTIGYTMTCRQLGINEVPVSPRLARTNPFGLPEILINYEEICQTLQNTPYQWMLEEK